MDVLLETVAAEIRGEAHPPTNYAALEFLPRFRNSQALTHAQRLTVAFVSRSIARAAATASTNSRGAAEIFSTLRSCKALASTRSAPTPSAKAPAAINSAAFAALTPPVGINRALGNGALSERKYLGPPTLPQGNIFTRRAPSFWAFINSVGVSAPGMANFRAAFATASTDEARPGLTRNSAPARRQDSACSAVVTVPAPMSTLLPYRVATPRITEM